MIRAALVAASLAAGAPALAQTPAQTPPQHSPPATTTTAAPENDNGRYSFNQTPEGLLRLDTRTGHVSLCTKREVGWACQIVPDERSALETEIGRLQGENVTLKKELISRGLALPSGSRPPKAEEKSNELVLKLPTDADLERAMGFFEKLWRRLVEMVQNTPPDKRS